MSRVQVGEAFGRWRVIRLAAPRAGRKACMVRCRCGRERAIQERRLTSGQSMGCSSPSCRHEAAALQRAIELLQGELEGSR